MYGGGRTLSSGTDDKILACDGFFHMGNAAELRL